MERKSLLDTLRNYWRLRSEAKSNLQGMARLVRALPAFLRDRVTVEQAKEEIKRGLGDREDRFLELARNRIYGNFQSPYLKLLKAAGCEFPDLQTQVRRYGLEAMLEELAREGVYLTSDEFKGKKEVVRGKLSFRVSPKDLQPATLSAGFVTQSSGTTNAPVRSMILLDRLAIQAFEMAIFLSAHGLLSSAHAMYDAILPAGGGVRNLLVNAKLGIAADRWYARKVPSNNSLERWYHYWSTYLIVLTAKWHGPGFPAPEFIETGDLGRIVRWVSEKRVQGNSCCIKTAASNATRIALAARKMGISLEGVKFIVGGEPFTESKRKIIHQAGASAAPRYAFSGGGTVGSGCASPLHADEVHVHKHTFALISRPEPANPDGVPVRPLLFTTLLSTAPRLFLNVENGDYGILEGRDCGCALERVGFTQHLHYIRSYEKFTSEGMNYFYGDLFEFLEKTLPSEFGGGPGDYQLVEEEDDNGQTRLTLVVRPDVGELDEARILSRLQQTLAAGSSANRFQSGVWQNAGTLRIERRAPHASPRGKILPLHLSR